MLRSLSALSASPPGDFLRRSCLYRHNIFLVRVRVRAHHRNFCGIICADGAQKVVLFIPAASIIVTTHRERIKRNELFIGARLHARLSGSFSIFPVSHSIDSFHRGNTEETAENCSREIVRRFETSVIVRIPLVSVFQKSPLVSQAKSSQISPTCRSLQCSPIRRACPVTGESRSCIRFFREEKMKKKKQHERVSQHTLIAVSVTGGRFCDVPRLINLRIKKKSTAYIKLNI